MKPKIIISEHNGGFTSVEYVNKHNRILGKFEDDYESSCAASILRLIDLLEKDGIDLDIEIIDKRE